MTRPILDLYLEADRRLGERVTKRWRDQEGIEFAGFWEGAVAGRPEEAEGL